MRPHRSILFVPANRERMLARAPTTGADALLLDLEDAVALDEKPVARAMAREYLGTLGGRPAFVRINAVSSGLARADLEAVVVPGLHGVFLAKAEGPDELRQVASWLDELEAGAGMAAGTVEIVCMLESANAVRQGYEIATASPRVASLCCSSGENGDLQADLGCAWSPEGTEMLFCRSKVVLDARAAGLAYPLDGVFVDVDDIDGLIVDTNLSRRLGYRGRTIIHPKHVEHVNRIFTPPAEEVEYYRGLLDAFDRAVADGRGAVSYRGKMIDYAMAARARSVLALADAIGAGDMG